MKFTRQEVKDIRREAEETLQKIFEKYNYQVDVGNITFGADVNMKVKIAKKATNEHGEFAYTKEAKTFIQRAKSMNLDESCINEEYNYKGKTYKILGYNTRAKRYPINITIDDKKFKCTEEQIKNVVKTVRPELFL